MPLLFDEIQFMFLHSITTVLQKPTNTYLNYKIQALILKSKDKCQTNK